MNHLSNPLSEVTSWGWQTNNWLASQYSSSGIDTLYTYNALGQVTQLLNQGPSSATWSEFSSLTHAATGSLTSETASVPGETTLSGSITNTYDSLDQLASSDSTRTATGMGYTQGFGTDGGGNLTTLRYGHGTFTYNNRNEITLTGFAYDSNGNPTTYRGNTLTFDPENRMTKYGSAMTYGYRFDGLRAWNSTGGTTTYFIYDQFGNPVLETKSGSVSAINTFGTNGLISRDVISGADTFYQFDPQGNTVTRSNNSATIVDYHGSDPYGDQYASASSERSVSGLRRAVGLLFDSVTGVSLLGHRYYDPAYARFLNQDPIGFGGGINVYSYAGNNPVNEVDPSGLDDGEPGYWAQAWGFFKGEMRALNPINWVAGPSQALGYLDGQGWSWEAFKHVGGGFIDGLEFWNKDDSGAAGESFMGDVLLLAPLVKKIPNLTGIKIPDIPPIEIGAFRLNYRGGCRLAGTC